MADTPEASDYTSVAERIAALVPYSSRSAGKPKNDTPTRPTAIPNATPMLPLRTEAHLAQLPLQPLMLFDATARLRAAIPFAFDDYLDLIETTGRCIRTDKRGASRLRARHYEGNAGFFRGGA